MVYKPRDNCLSHSILLTEFQGLLSIVSYFVLLHANIPQCYLGQLAETVLAAVVEGVTGRGLETGSSTLGQVGGGQGRGEN